jgi:predicted DNA-binding transcriptional regulator AlpA
MDAPPRYVCRKEIMRLTGLAYSTLWLMQTRGDFPQGFKMGSRTMWRLDQVVDFLKSRPHAPLKHQGD